MATQHDESVNTSKMVNADAARYFLDDFITFLFVLLSSNAMPLWIPSFCSSNLNACLSIAKVEFLFISCDGPQLLFFFKLKLIFKLKNIGRVNMQGEMVY